MRYGKLGQQKHPTQVHRHQSIPVVDAELLAVGDDEKTGVVDDDIDAAEVIDRRIDEAPNTLLIGNICLDEVCLSTDTMKFLCSWRRRVLLMEPPAFWLFLQVCDDHASTFAGQLQTDPPADAGTASGDDGDTTLQSHALGNLLMGQPTVGGQSTRARTGCQSILLLGLTTLLLGSGIHHADAASVSDRDVLSRIETSRTFKDSLFRHDGESPLRPEDVAGFEGLRYYPPDLSWRFVGQLHRYGRTRQIPLADTGGSTIAVERFGRFVFEHEEKQYWLEIYRSLQGGDLTVYYTDLTTGESTYSAGRYAPISRTEEGAYVLDFNGSYNPYCAYNTDYICPLPPAHNYLPFAVTAGELDVGPDLAHQPSGP